MGNNGAVSYPTETTVTLRASGIRAISIQAILLVAASMVLPAAAHLSGLPVRFLLPMHWPVVLVGLVYGWRSGAIVGLAAPGLSYLVSGMPHPAVLPAMTLELGAYGLLAGAYRQRFQLNPFLATGLALVGGRLVFLAAAVVCRSDGLSVLDYLRGALIPGLPAAVLQVLVLPVVARSWVRRSSSA
jgi:hypothetical protein